MIDYSRVFHTGFLVDDLGTAMKAYGQALGLSWATPATLRGQAFWSPEQGSHCRDLEVTYSLAGPQHIEIQRGPKDSFYDPTRHRAYHVGMWCDDLPGEAARLIATGWQVGVANAPPEDGFGLFVYLVPPAGGLMVEFVSPAFKPMFDDWLAGEATLGRS